MNRKIRFTLLVFWLSLPCAGFVFAQSGWARTFGGGSADTPNAIVPTPDGGFVVAGSTASFGAGSDDGWIMKMDATGSVQWQKAYGGSTFEDLWALQITTDGGYIAAGTTGVYPNADVWILKLSPAGDIEWQKSFGGPNYDEGLAIQQTSDGGYIVVCNTSSFGAGIGDAWILKLSSSGGLQWQKTYGGPQYEYALTIQQTTDGGYIVGGLTQSFGAGGSDIWVLKLDSLGSVVWQKAFGTNLQDYASALQQTTDGGYIVAGKVGTGTDDCVVLKLDSSGNIQWQRTYGGAGFDMVSALEQTADGGYVVSGTTTSFGAGSYDLWILKLDNTGAIQWQKSYGGGDNDHNGLIRQMPGGGYIVAATTLSFGSGDFDTWILRLDANGEIGASCNLPSDTLARPHVFFIEYRCNIGERRLHRCNGFQHDVCRDHNDRRRIGTMRSVVHLLR